MNEFELWLDESGDFEMESQHKNPSLVGGVLSPKGLFTSDDLRKLVSADSFEYGHAMEMTKGQARRIVPNALEAVCKAGCKLVYFENIERIDYHTNRDLYLRVLAAGLAQLSKFLSTMGQFRLEIIVALRSSRDNNGTLHLIRSEEYRNELKTYIANEFEDISFVMDPTNRIGLTIMDARVEPKLFLADFACNAKFSINSEKYFPVKERLQKLIDKSYRFTVTALTTETVIRAKLSNGDISGALMDYYTTKGQLDKPKMFHEILDNFMSKSYRLQRLQLRKFSAELRNYVAKETDFERSEGLLQSVIGEFYEDLMNRNIIVQSDESLFWLYLSLADMYLREGDVLHAKPVMDAMDTLVKGMNYRVENLAHLYFYRDKKALYEINCMDYTGAAATMEATISAMESLIDVLDADPLVGEYFRTGKGFYSEYLGDAYCMKIYAELFLQRFDKNLYESVLREDTEKAIAQYHYPGELERSQQYRSKAENEAGHCRAALDWLLMTQEITVERDDIQNACLRYLVAARQEDLLSRCYYAMYYVEILENAMRSGQRDLAESMMTALEKEKSMLLDLLQPRKPIQMTSVTGERPVVYEDIFTDTKSPRRYHPLEIVLWKYGSYQAMLNNTKAAETYWAEALAVCGENPDYTVLKLVAAAIQLERFSYIPADKQSEKRALRRDISKRASNVLALSGLPSEMEAYARSILAFAEQDGDPADFETAYKLSRRIAF